MVYRDLFRSPQAYKRHLHAVQDMKPDGRTLEAQASSRDADMVDLLRKEWEFHNPPRTDYLTDFFDL